MWTVELSGEVVCVQLTSGPLELGEDGGGWLTLVTLDGMSTEGSDEDSLDDANTGWLELSNSRVALSTGRACAQWWSLRTRASTSNNTASELEWWNWGKTEQRCFNLVRAFAITWKSIQMSATVGGWSAFIKCSRRLSPPFPGRPILLQFAWFA